MADEISVTTKLVYAGKDSIDKGAKGFTIPEETTIIDQTGLDLTKSTQSIGTSAAEEVVVSNEIGTQGWWMVWNTNLNTGVVYLGVSGQTKGQMVLKAKPGDPPLSFRAAAPVYAQASDAAVSIEYLCLEE
jgi:hypothetical protein